MLPPSCIHAPMHSSRTPCGLLLLLTVSACGVPAGEQDAIREYRIRTGAVCAAYDALRGRATQIDTTDAETRDLHQQAMEVCDIVEMEGGRRMGT